jgi:aminopeptidase N
MKYSAVPVREDATQFRSLGSDDTPILPAPVASQGLLRSGLQYLSALSLPAKAALGFSLFALVLGSILGAVLRRPAAASPSVCDWSAYRLPGNVAPTAYAVSFSPSLTPDGLAFATNCSTASGACPYTGTTTVDVRVLAASPCILIHSSGLDIASATVANLGTPGAPALPLTWREDAVNERLVLAVPSGAGAAPGALLRLSFAFSAPLGTTNTGLYQSLYTSDSGSTVVMVSTQFEATAARRAFVSFDEPALKANFTLTLDGFPTAYTALGNMPPATGPQPRGNGLLGSTVTFQATPPMSTYLLAVVCGNLTSVSQTLPPNPSVGRAASLPVTGWAVARGDNQANLVYAVDGAMKVIPYFETLFGVSFPLPKMDLVAAPAFAAGAMEDWGLIIFRETALLARVGVNSASELQRVAVVVAHELAHQWSGNIVTMEWWNALWLNEGFAARMEYVGTDRIDPTFQIDQQFQYGTIIRALRSDCFSDVQQLTQTVSTSAEVEGQFSSISYQKGASLIFMIQAYLADLEAASLAPPNSFYSGVNLYLSACSEQSRQAPAYGGAAGRGEWHAQPASQCPDL